MSHKDTHNFCMDRHIKKEQRRGIRHVLPVSPSVLKKLLLFPSPIL